MKLNDDPEDDPGDAAKALLEFVREFAVSEVKASRARRGSVAAGKKRRAMDPDKSWKLKRD